MSDDNAADLIRLVRECHPCSEPVRRLANLAEQQAAENETLRRDVKTLTEPNLPAEIEKLASDLGTARYGSMLACVGLCDKAADKLRDQAAEIERLNGLLTGIDHVESMAHKLRRNELETTKEQLAAAQAELATARGLLEGITRSDETSKYYKKKIDSFLSPASPSPERIKRQQEINAAGEANRTRHGIPASPRPEPGAVAEVGCGPCGIGPDEPMTHEELLKFTNAIITRAARDEMRKLNEADAVAVREKTPDELRESIDYLGERLKQVKSDYITLWQRVVQAGGVGNSETQPLERALQEVDHWQEERKQLNAGIEELHGWLRDKEATIGSWSLRAEAAEAMLEQAKAAQPATCLPMTGEGLYDWFFTDTWHSWDQCSDDYQRRWNALAAHIWPSPQPQPDRRAELDSQVVVTRHNDSLLMMSLGDVLIYVYQRYDARWAFSHQDRCDGVFDSRESAERAARDLLVEQALKQDDPHYNGKE